jgi:hypothetical protein
MQRLVARAVGAAVLAVGALVVVAGPAVAQTDTTVADTNAPATAAGTTTTTIACPVFAAADAQFVGTATQVGDVAVRFHVDRVDGGAIAANDVDVDYPDDARFLKVGTQYRVPVLRDAESDRFVSKVRAVAPDRGGVVAECAKRDPVLTTMVDGKPIDTGVFSGLHGAGRKAIWAFVLPTVGVLGALVALVIAKRMMTWSYHRVVTREASGGGFGRDP